MSIKVGLLTFHCTDNPASALQAYALKHTIEKMGCECDILNYQRKWWKIKYYMWYGPYFKKKYKIFSIFFWMLFVPVLMYRSYKYEAFRKNKLNISKKIISSPKQLAPLNSQYDYFVVGSDQIWNRNNSKVDDTYFLDFVSDNFKKIAYAPSFGISELPDGEKARDAELITQFKALSVRESQGQAILQNLCGISVPIVLDPSLLIHASEWKSMAQSPESKDYIFVYLRKLSPSIVRIVNMFVEKTGLPVIQDTGISKCVNNGQSINSPTPQEWLGLISNAKYIITNSFHGVAFSINFNKQFFVEPINGSVKDTNSRVYSILEQFGLQSRIIDEEFDIDKVQEIDYEPINEKLAQKREFSMDFLNNALLGGNEK